MTSGSEAKGRVTFTHQHFLAHEQLCGESTTSSTEKPFTFLFYVPFEASVS